MATVWQRTAGQPYCSGGHRLGTQQPHADASSIPFEAAFGSRVIVSMASSDAAVAFSVRALLAVHRLRHVGTTAFGGNDGGPFPWLFFAATVNV